MDQMVTREPQATGDDPNRDDQINPTLTSDTESVEAENPPRFGLRTIVDVTKAVVAEWRADRIGGLASEVAFWLVLSVFPGLLVMAALIGSLEPILGSGLAAETEEAVISYLQRVLGAESNGVITATTGLFQSTDNRLLTVGIVGAVFSVSRGFAALIRGLDIAYEADVYRSWISARLMGAFLSLVSLLTFVFSAVLLVVGPQFVRGATWADRFGFDDWFDVFWSYGRAPLAFFIVVAWATTMYHFGPRHQSPWKWDLPGAILASSIWLATSLGFSWYMETLGGNNAVVGAVSGALTLMLFVYALTVCFLIGAELNQVLAKRFGIGHVGEASASLQEVYKSGKDWFDARR